MTRYSFTRYRYVEILVSESPSGKYYLLPDVVDKYGNPYYTMTLSSAKSMISRALHGNSKNYRLTSN